MGDSLTRRYAVTFYCPDRHLTYDGNTPDSRGVGGGVTARLRLAAALAGRGHSVDVVCNCAAAITVNSVRFLPLDTLSSIKTDVLVMHTTGDKLDLTPILSLNVEAGQRVVFVDGVDAPKGLDVCAMHRLYACSNFIAGIAREKWLVPADKLFVTHHGVVSRYFRKHWWQPRNRQRHRIAYATHPSKGLDAALGVLRQLRLRDERFELHIFGGNRLWGQPEANSGDEPGVVYHGLLGQRELAKRLTECTFALYLQTRAEPFGIAIAEALAAGCVTIASPVGAHPEIIEQGVTGFLVEGDPTAHTTRDRATELIVSSVGDRRGASAMSKRAQSSPLDWDTVAATWEQYWQGGDAAPVVPQPVCRQCSGRYIALADGWHCTNCGYYSKPYIG